MIQLSVFNIVRCQPLSDIGNGSVTCSLGDDSISSFEDTCDITCKKGFALNGSATRTCLSDGTWNGTNDECIKGKNVYDGLANYS